MGSRSPCPRSAQESGLPESSKALFLVESLVAKMGLNPPATGDDNPGTENGSVMFTGRKSVGAAGISFHKLLPTSPLVSLRLSLHWVSLDGGDVIH